MVGRRVCIFGCSHFASRSCSPQSQSRLKTCQASDASPSWALGCSSCSFCLFCCWAQQTPQKRPGVGLLTQGTSDYTWSKRADNELSSSRCRRSGSGDGGGGGGGLCGGGRRRGHGLGSGGRSSGRHRSWCCRTSSILSCSRIVDVSVTSAAIAFVTASELSSFC